MKKLIIIICAIILNINYSFSQLTLSHVYTTDAPSGFVKLSLSGLKYFYFNRTPAGFYTYIKLYNPDHSLFKTISIPTFPGKDCNKISHISETLFNNDTLIEYIPQYIFSGPGGISAVRVCNENGNILLERDTAGAGGAVGWLDLGVGGQTIFPNGTSSKLIVGKAYYSGTWSYTTEIYDLPGQLTCLECDNGVISGLIHQPNLISEDKVSVAFPNPFTDYIKIKYSLPENFKSAFINLFDITGNLIKKKEIDKNFNEVIITSEEIKQGAYLYQIVADDKIISIDKIIKL